jgi:hypothetical protein
MRTTGITVARTLSDGNYGSNSISVSVELNETDKLGESVDKVKAFIDSKLGLDVPAPPLNSKSSTDEGKEFVNSAKPEKTSEEKAEEKKKKLKKLKLKKLRMLLSLTIEN